MSRVLVTAASGSVGTSCVEALLRNGFDVVGTSREPSKLRRIDKFEARTYDADAETDFDALFEGIDDVVLIGPPLDGHIDLKLAPLVDAAARKGIAHLVFVSGSANHAVLRQARTCRFPRLVSNSQVKFHSTSNWTRR